MKHLKTQKQLNEASENLNISDVSESKKYECVIVKIKYGANCPKKYWNKKAVKKGNKMLEYHKGFNLSYGSVFMINPTENDYEEIK